MTRSISVSIKSITINYLIIIINRRSSRRLIHDWDARWRITCRINKFPRKLLIFLTFVLSVTSDLTFSSFFGCHYSIGFMFSIGYRTLSPCLASHFTITSLPRLSTTLFLLNKLPVLNLPNKNSRFTYPFYICSEIVQACIETIDAISISATFPSNEMHTMPSKSHLRTLCFRHKNQHEKVWCWKVRRKHENKWFGNRSNRKCTRTLRFYHDSLLTVTSASRLYWKLTAPWGALSEKRQIFTLNPPKLWLQICSEFAHGQQICNYSRCFLITSFQLGYKFHVSLSGAMINIHFGWWEKWIIDNSFQKKFTILLLIN